MTDLHIKKEAEAIALSVLVAVYNVEKYIRKCLESFISQSFESVEFIVVDDGSTDRSGNICDEYARKDSRIKVIHKAKNEGCLLSRKTAISHAKGRWICFVDGDDYLPSKDSLSQLVKHAETEDVDILKFDVAFEGGSHEQKQSILKFLGESNIARLEGVEIAKQCFSRELFSFNIWNKIYRASVIKKTIEYYPSIHFNSAEDAYQFFLFSYFARSFRSIHTSPLYCYRLGSGISTAQIKLDKFESYAKEILVVQWLRDFLDCENKTNKYKEAIHALENRLTNTAIWRFVAIPEEDKAKAFGLLLKYFDIEKIINPLYERYQWQIATFARMIYGASCFQLAPRAVRTIGIFYHRLYEGGVERVISRQIPMLLQMGYKVVLFTEDIQKEREYDIPPEVIRYQLPKRYENGRASAFIKGLKTNCVDLLLHHSASSRDLLFDIVLIKCLGIPVVLTRHELTTQDLVECYTPIFDLPHVYRLVDKLVVLSRMEEVFYQNMGVNSVYVPNPIENQPQELDHGQREDIVLWIGRLDKRQKNYEDALRIMKQIVQLRPNTQCYIVGGEFSRGASAEVQSFIKSNNLTNSVKWFDHTLDVDSFYRKAKVHLVTSRYESFAMMIMESKTYGIPMVNYDMPYLEILANKKGYVSVPQYDVYQAAEEVVNILNDQEKWARLSTEANESIVEFRSKNLISEWKRIINEIQEENHLKDTSELQRLNLMFWDTMRWHLEGGITNLRNAPGKYMTPEQKSRKLHRRLGRWFRRQKNKIIKLMN